MISRIITTPARQIDILAGSWPLVPERPTLIFLHGAALTKAFWTAQVEGLADAANTIAIDLPGRNGSTLAGDENTTCDMENDIIGGYASAVTALMDHLQLKNPVLCGLSMGGAVALSLLLRHPERFQKAILMNTGARLKVMPMIFETLKNNYAGYQDMVVAFSTSGKSDREKIKEQMQAIAVSNPAAALRDFTACDQFDVMAELGRIRAAVQIVTGADDGVTPPKYGEFLHQGIAGSGLTSIDDVGHLSPLENPDAVNQVIRKFMAQPE